jgi:hypothetical protein
LLQVRFSNFTNFDGRVWFGDYRNYWHSEV